MHTIPWRWKVDTRLLLTLFLPAADVYTHTGGGTPQRVGREREILCVNLLSCSIVDSGLIGTNNYTSTYMRGLLLLLPSQ